MVTNEFFCDAAICFRSPLGRFSKILKFWSGRKWKKYLVRVCREIKRIISKTLLENNFRNPWLRKMFKSPENKCLAGSSYSRSACSQSPRLCCMFVTLAMVRNMPENKTSSKGNSSANDLSITLVIFNKAFEETSLHGPPQ